jgi:hypothetical protein
MVGWLVKTSTKSETNMSDETYDVVLDTLQKHHDKLMELTMQNMRSEFLGINIMDGIRLEQCEQLKEAMEVWKAHKRGDTI